MRVLSAVLFVYIVTMCSGLFLRTQFCNHEPLGVIGNGDPGDALFLTPLIKAGMLDEARSRSKVGALPNVNITSYSGYLTVKETCNSNMFFWFFPAESGDLDAPVLLWLQGGPGDASMFGLFNEHGPFYLDDKLTLQKRLYSWTRKYSVIYIDNPVGTGFSFTENDACYATNEDDVAEDLFSALTQFFIVFADYQPNDFYVTGESYAGKYVPAIAEKIHEAVCPPVKINLRGIIIGNGLCDPETMIPAYAPFMYNIGLLDNNQQKYVATHSEVAVGYIKAERFINALGVFYGSIFGSSWFYNQTGFGYLYNYLQVAAPKEFDYFTKFLPQDSVRNSIHVGNKPFNNGNKAHTMLLADFMDTIKPRFTKLLNANYKVLMYSGMLDILVALPLTEAFLESVPWSGLKGYMQAPRKIWKLKDTDVDVAGYVKVYKNLVQVGVRGAGHILPYDQPERAWAMIDQFISQFNPK